MGKYFQLQCKRMLRYLPGALFAALILLCSGLLAFRLFTQQNASRAENQKFPLAVCGQTEHTFLQMGLSALTSFDSTRFSLEVLEMEEAEAARALAGGTISAYVVIPEGFMEAAFSGTILPIKFYSTAGAAGLVSLVKEELSKVISTLLINSQQGVYGMWDAMADNGLRGNAGGQMERMALVYVEYILARDRIYSLQELGIGDELGLEGYLLCGLSVLFLMLICLPFGAQMIPGDPALGRLLTSKGKPAWQQALCDFVAYAAAMLCLLLILTTAGKLFLPKTIPIMELLLKTVPVLLFAASFSFMLYSLSRDLIGGISLQFFVTVILCFVSGCLYPIHFFPARVQQLAQWLPTGIARTQLASCITGSAPAWTLPMLLGWCTAFVAIGVAARVRHIQGVKQ